MSTYLPNYTFSMHLFPGIPFYFSSSYLSLSVVNQYFLNVTCLLCVFLNSLPISIKPMIKVLFFSLCKIHPTSLIECGTFLTHISHTKYKLGMMQLCRVFYLLFCYSTLYYLFREISDLYKFKFTFMNYDLQSLSVWI